MSALVLTKLMILALVLISHEFHHESHHESYPQSTEPHLIQ